MRSRRLTKSRFERLAIHLSGIDFSPRGSRCAGAAIQFGHQFRPLNVQVANISVEFSSPARCSREPFALGGELRGDLVSVPPNIGLTCRDIGEAVGKVAGFGFAGHDFHAQGFRELGAFHEFVSHNRQRGSFAFEFLLALLQSGICSIQFLVGLTKICRQIIDALLEPGDRLIQTAALGRKRSDFVARMVDLDDLAGGALVQAPDLHLEVSV